MLCVWVECMLLLGMELLRHHVLALHLLHLLSVLILWYILHIPPCQVHELWRGVGREGRYI